MTTYNEMENKLLNKEDFRGNSVTAYTDTGRYIVKSYNTIMLVIFDDGTMDFNNKYYSNTTSRIQNMLIRVYNLRNHDIEPEKAFKRDC